MAHMVKYLCDQSRVTSPETYHGQNISGADFSLEFCWGFSSKHNPTVSLSPDEAAYYNILGHYVGKCRERSELYFEFIPGEGNTCYQL